MKTSHSMNLNRRINNKQQTPSCEMWVEGGVCCSLKTRYLLVLHLKISFKCVIFSSSIFFICLILGRFAKNHDALGSLRRTNKIHIHFTQRDTSNFHFFFVSDLPNSSWIFFGAREWMNVFREVRVEEHHQVSSEIYKIWIIDNFSLISLLRLILPRVNVRHILGGGGSRIIDFYYILRYVLRASLSLSVDGVGARSASTEKPIKARECEGKEKSVTVEKIVTTMKVISTNSLEWNFSFVGN